MSPIRASVSPVLIASVALALSACAPGEGGPAGNTELNVVVPNGAPSLGGGSSAPGLIDIQSVEYTINCLGNNDTFLENAASFPDEVRLEGNLEVVDGRTDPQGPIPPEFGTPRPGDGAEVWQGFMDLPPGPCTVQLRARDNDGEVICTATEPFTITADTTAKVNLVLVCDVSFQAPVGMLDVDATFSFVVSNFCPDLFVLNCLERFPLPQFVAPGFPPIVATTCEVRFRDGDSQCGESCDPQTCVVTPEGIDCSPGPDPGVSTTITCVDGQIDCDFNPLTVETECTFAGDTLGLTPVGGPIVPNAPGAGAFAVACIPPALGGTPGASIVCTAVTTDGDEDCNKTKTVFPITSCPGTLSCGEFAEANGGPPTTAGGDAACQNLTNTVCLASLCNEATCDGATQAACCDDFPINEGGNCSPENPPIAFCESGICQSTICNDLACQDGNPCTVNTCNFATGLCETVPVPDGAICPLAGCTVPGSDQGSCIATVCVPSDSCVTSASCPNTPLPPASPQCTQAVCDDGGGLCATFCTIDPAANAGGVCDASGPGAADGTCLAGACQFTPGSCNLTQTGDDLTPQTAIVSVACTNNVTTAQSPFPFTLSVDVQEPVLGGSPFDATFDGIGTFPEFFLDAAQAVVPGGVQAAILEDIVATVQIRSGATGPDVPLLADLSSLVPGPTRFCNFPTDQVCAADSECLGGVCNPPVNLAAIPTSNDCGGVCAGLGKEAAQCLVNGFCVTGDLTIEFEASAPTAYTADASGSVLFGWADQGVPDLFLCPSAGNCTEAFQPDGCYDLPAAVFANPTAPIGIRVNVNNALFVPIQCAMGEPGGICASGEGCLVDGDCATAPCTITTDVVCPTPDASLISCPIN